VTGTAAEQLRRILHLIPYLADGETHAYDDVAARAGVDRSVLMGDIESISERFEAPGGFVEGLQIYIGSDGLSVVPNHFLRPMRLTRGELLALELGLAMIRTERPLEERHAIDGARERLRKVIALLPDEQLGDGARVASLSHGGNLEYLRRLRAAFRQRHKVRLSYRKATDAAAASRVICPYGIAFASGMWYVIAGNEGGEGIRIFRLDRVENVDVLEMGFERPRDFSVDAVVRDGRAFQGGEAAPLKVRYSARIARWIAEREGLEPAADGSLTVEHPLADTDWAVRHILQYGPDAEVLAPAEVKAELGRRLAAMDARG
jgi:proteasome accessory factor C